MTEKKDHFHIVGIGASAGGLEALEHFFTAMPDGGDMAFVIIQHLSPDYKSHMVELLSKYTPMPVHEAKDGIAVQPNNIYLLPHRKNMTIFKGKLYLVDYQRTRSPNLPIDIFFESLAKDQGEHAIGIILSGTGSDGSRGLRTIKELGGMVMAQDESAKFDGMPRSATSTRLVDYVLPPQQMPASLLSYVHHPCLASDPSIKPAIAKEEDQMGKLFAILRDTTGVDFTSYKPNTITRRIERRMTINRIDKLIDYVDYLQESPSESQILFKEFLISVTRFFRDPEAYKILEKDVLPTLFEGKSRQTQIRIWVPGCATGEEAYSLAILFREHMERTGQFVDVKIFATDLDKEALEYASQGVYPESILGDIPKTRLQNYFIKRGDVYEIMRHIRTMVVFAQQDLIKDPPFSRMDLISCRNLLIYLQPVLQRKVLNTFQFALKPGGFLFLGSSETVSDYADTFVSKHNKWRVYEYQGGPLPTLNPSYPSDRNGSLHVSKAHSLSPSPKVEDWRSSDSVLRALVENLLPPCLVIDEQKTLIHAFGNLEPYLHAPKGFRINLSIQSMIRPELSLPIVTAIHRTLQSNEEVVYRGITLTDDEKSHQVDLRSRVFWEKGGKHRLVMITINPVKSDISDKTGESFDLSQTANQRISDLEQELQYIRENLQATIEELETSNEELQATNEELMAANEELQSTNEELQSVNEELITVNSEYQLKIGELTDLNDDVNNLLKSTNIGTIFLDDQLNLRKFTPAAQLEVNVMEQDIGRPFNHITHCFPNVDLTAVARNVLDTLVRTEVELESDSGNWYLLRVLPYNTHANLIEGVVLTLVNITPLKKAQLIVQHLDAAQNYLNLIDTTILALDKDGLITFINQKGADILGTAPTNLVGQNWSLTYLSEPEGSRFNSMLQRIFAGERVVDFIENSLTTPDNKHHLIHWQFASLQDESGKVTGVLGSGLDITEQHQAQVALAESEARYRAMAHHLPNGALFLFDQDLRYLLADGAEIRRLGLEPNYFEGKQLREIYPDEVGEWLEDAYKKTLAGEELVLDYYHAAANHHYTLHLAPVKDIHGQIYAGMVLSQNITVIKQAEEALTSSEERLRLALNNAPVMLYQTDEELRYVWVHNSFYGQNSKRLLGKTDFDLDLPPNEAKYMMDLKEAVIKHGQERRQEISLTIEGETQHFDLNLEPLRTEDGALIGITATAVNITKLKQPELASKQEQLNFYKALAENLPGSALVTFDKDLRYLSAEGQGILENGYTPSDFVGKSIWEILPEKICHIMQEPYQATFRGKTTTFQVNIEDSLYLINAMPKHNGHNKIEAGLALIQNVTEFKHG